MRHVHIEDVGPEVREMIGSVDDEPAVVTDGDVALARVVPHREYATLLALAHAAARPVTPDPDESRRDVARDFEERKAANLSVQEAYAYRQQLWTIKA